MAAEMHSGFSNLRRELPMNVRRTYRQWPLEPRGRGEIDRIMQLWAQARARFGGTGDFLFGDWCAADIMFAPVVTRFVTYRVPVPPFAAAYMEAVLGQADVVEWIELAQDEPWVIEQYEATRNRRRRLSVSRAWDIHPVAVAEAAVARPDHVDVRIAAGRPRPGADGDERARLVACDCPACGRS